jgi:hypothetical protein
MAGDETYKVEVTHSGEFLVVKTGCNLKLATEWARTQGYALANIGEANLDRDMGPVLRFPLSRLAIVLPKDDLSLAHRAVTHRPVNVKPSTD